MKGLKLEAPFEGLLGYPQTIRGGKSEGRDYMYIYDPSLRTGRLMSLARYQYSILHGVVPPDELHVDHVTENRHDDDIETLQLLTAGENNQKTVLMSQGFIRSHTPQFCKVCKTPVFSSKVIVTCSRKCNGVENTKRLTGAAGRTLSEELQMKISAARKEGGTSYSIAKDLGISRNTVMKYW